MTPVYTPEVQAQVRAKMRGGVLLAAAPLLLALGIAAAAILARDLTWQLSLFAAVCAAASGIAAYSIFQRQILPLYRADRLMGELARQGPEPLSGTFSGVREAKALQGGLLMRKLCIDAGGQVRGEAVNREINLPAVFSFAPLPQGTRLEVEAVKNVLTASEPPIRVTCAPSQGAYRVSPLVCALIILLCGVGAGGVYSAKQAAAAEDALQISVCTPAHHDESQRAIEAALEENGLSTAVFHYTDTIDRETVALYLATHGAYEADILLLNGEHYASVFDCEGYVLDTEKLESALGGSLKYVTDREGRPTGVVLYDPADADYSRRFSGLVDWIAVEADVPLIAAIRKGTQAGGSAQDTLVCILGHLEG